MKLSHLNLLKCIECGGSLALSGDHKSQTSGETIELGVLACEKCYARFPVINSVGVFFKQEWFAHFLNPNEKQICASLGLDYNKISGDLFGDSLRIKNATDNWSYQWNTLAPWNVDDFEKDDFKGKRMFNAFIRIEPEEYNLKKVIVWCGGNGRETYHVSKNNPDLLVVIEIGDEIYRISALLDSKINLLLIRGDMLNNPMRNGIADISICDHALQHIVDKQKAFLAITDVLKPEGTVAICVYSYENNFLMTHIIEPLKPILHKLPLKAQAMAALLPATLIFFLIHCFYVPARHFLSERFYRKIPLLEHMIFWSTSDLQFINMACFDLIHAPVSHHFTMDEISDLAQMTGLSILKLINTHGTTWSMTAKKN